jgi:hypothetical protein
MKKPLPKFDSYEQLEAFLDAADLDEYDLTAGALPRRRMVRALRALREGRVDPPAAAGLTVHCTSFATKPTAR